MLAVIAEFKIRKGAEAKFEQAIGEMQAHVKSFDGYLGEEPCQSLADGKKFVTIYLLAGQRIDGGLAGRCGVPTHSGARERKDILLVSHLRRRGRAQLRLERVGRKRADLIH